ncbi:MAG: hypothetical protein WA952_12355 [Lewinella sp.]
MKTLESVVKMLSAIAVPIVIAIIGYDIQAGISDKNLERDYIQIAVDILADADPDPRLREWAVDMLNEYAEIKMKPAIREDLKRGNVSLPTGGGARILRPKQD